MAAAKSSTENKTTDNLIRAKFDELKAKKEAILSKTAGLRAKRDDLLSKMEALRPQVAELTVKIRAIEDPGITTISEDISRLSKALGGRGMSDSRS